MKKKDPLHLFIFLLTPFFGNAQVNENFSDGEFSSNPAWVGGLSDWTVNPAFVLQSNNTVAGSTYYLSTASTLATTAQWELLVNLNFNPSSTNYLDVYLTASAIDLTATATTGYFVRIGNADDEIALYRKESTGSMTKIIDGVNGITNKSSNTIMLKLVRDAASQWTLYRDITGTGNSYFAEGSVSDATFSNSAFFGILVRQSTVGFFQRHFIDDIEVKPYIPDVIPPGIKTATAKSSNEVDILFDEPLDNSSSRLAANYMANNSLGVPAFAILDANNAALVHLGFAGSFTSGINNQLTINGVMDLAGNAILNGTINFTYFVPYTARQFDVVIDEIMADPAPVVALPNIEWIELKNTSTSAINLQGWRIGDATGRGGPMPDFILLPDSFVIVCSSASQPAMSVFGNTISLPGFPSLDNISDQLYLQSAQNRIIHSVSYTDSWYGNPLKKGGGWTLEMIDTKNPCGGFSNWKASTDLSGGTPGRKNTLDGINADKSAPKLLRAYTTDSIHVILVFDEPIDSVNAATPGNFSISDGIGIPLEAVAVSPTFDRIILQLNNALQRNRVYTVTVKSVTDCVGNQIGNANNARTGLAEVATVSDIVINEILFNPTSAGTDYVEIYNRSKKILDLKQTYIANRSSSGVINNITPVSADNYLFFPGDFMVVTESAAIVKASYITRNMDAFAEIGNMPSFNDDKGTAIILNAQGEVTDELAYNEKWHFKLIDNPEGVALERIDYNSATQSPDNWHSAAASAGYGTPTYKNSQYSVNDGVKGYVNISPGILSPDNDGQDDFATIDYNFPEAGYVATITIFDASGRPVRYLQRNALCGTKGVFRWDGLGEKNQRLAIGVYIVFTEVFNLKGTRKQFKNAIVLARRVPH